MTSEFMLLSMALLGGASLRDFSVILLVGLLMGTYSSIFIAAPLLVVWETKEWKNWFGKGKKAHIRSLTILSHMGQTGVETPVTPTIYTEFFM